MKKVLAIIFALVLVFAFCGCNRRGIVLDTQNQANWAEIRHFNGTRSIVEVKTWSQDEQGYTITTKGGNVIFVDGVNCILSKDKPEDAE